MFLSRDVRSRSTARKVLLVMRPHGVFHSTIWISRILHSHISISIPHLGSRSRGGCKRLRMRAHSTLILVVYESYWRLGLRIAVVISRHWGLVWWGVAVVSSRRPGRIREGLIRVHCGTGQAFLETGGGIGIASQAGLGVCKAKLLYEKVGRAVKPPVGRKRVAGR
jgi:hypothetical protein